MSTQSGSIKQWLTSTPPSVWAMLVIIATAIVGGLITISATSQTNGAADAIATVVAAVAGIGGVHIGHVMGHQHGGQWRWPHWGVLLGLLVIVLAMAAFVVVLVKTNWSAEATATVVAAVVGIAGTHVGHVIGHQLGQDRGPSTSQRSGPG